MENSYFLAPLYLNDLTSGHASQAHYLIVAASRPEAETVLVKQARTMFGDNAEASGTAEFIFKGAGGMRVRPGELLRITAETYAEISRALPSLFGEGVAAQGCAKGSTPIPGYSNLGQQVPGVGCLFSATVTVDVTMSAKVLVKARDEEEAELVAREFVSSHGALVVVDDSNYKGIRDFYVGDPASTCRVESPLDFGLPPAANHRFAKAPSLSCLPGTEELAFVIIVDDYEISDPGISQCGRFVVDPLATYGISAADAAALDELNCALCQARFDDAASEEEIVGDTKEKALANEILAALTTAGNTVYQN